MNIPSLTFTFPVSTARPRHGLLIAVLLIQAACVGGGRQPRIIFEEPFPEPGAPASRSEPREQPRPPARVEHPPEPASPEGRTGGGAAVAKSPAVLALQGEAATSLASGDYDGAAASLERAIRIQPRNPELWHDLAEVRLKQQQPGLAEDLAKKSNLHAKGNGDLIRSNWALIAEARRLKGDTEGAADAQDKAAR
jgi:predicted Zn-dependent protease